LEPAQNSQRKILPITTPTLQMDSGNYDSCLAYLLPPDTTPPNPDSKDLKLVEVPEQLVAVGAARGFGSDRGRTEEGLEEQRSFLVSQVENKGFKVTQVGRKAFTLANYPDGYEMWLTVETERS
jgi:hypothetical protein